MKMIRNFAWLRAAVLMAVALALSASHAAAGSLLQGRFKLPTEAHWGLTVLPAGEYSFTVESVGSFPMVAVRAIDGKCAGMFQAQSISKAKDSGEPVLTLTREGGEMFVSSLAIGEMEVVLEYRIPKVAEAPTMGMSTQPSQPVVVAASHH
jgi:uncharacterized membrane protein